MLKWYDNDANKGVIRRVEEIAKKTGHTMAQIALAWIMAKDPVAAPIVGTTNLKNLEDLIGMSLPNYSF